VLTNADIENQMIFKSRKEMLQMAKKYYIESFTWSRLESLDNKLFKRSLKSLI
jgi:hypothetical protein